jgi:Cu(I)/Ag(I) efflux system periplasmic protein CusF
MKRLTLVLSAALLAAPAFAQMKGMEMKSEKAASHKATGVVTKPPANGKVTIKHDPIESLKWPGMTMGFVIKDKAVADKLKPGAKIEFEFVQQGKDYVVTSVK